MSASVIRMARMVGCFKNECILSIFCFLLDYFKYNVQSPSPLESNLTNKRRQNRGSGWASETKDVNYIYLRPIYQNVV